MQGMATLPDADATVILPDVPKGQSYMLTRQAIGDLAEHPRVVTAFSEGAATVLVIGSEGERERVSALLQAQSEVSFMGPDWEPPTPEDFDGSKAA